MSLTVAQVHQRLRHIIDSSHMNTNDQLEAFQIVLKDIMSLSDNPVSSDVIEMLKVMIEISVDKNVSLGISRQIFNDFSTEVLPNMIKEQSKQLALFILDKMDPRTDSFETQMCNIRMHLATIFETDKNWKDAVLVLIASTTDSEQKMHTIEHRFEICIRIARMYLEDNDALQAQSYINRASMLKSMITNETQMTSFKFTHARVLDYHHRFNEAAHKYNECSLSLDINESERTTALKSAIVCTILSPAGPPRFRMLTTLYKDERCKTLMRFSILEKLYLCRIIKPNEVDQIESMLLPHQKAKTKYNTSLLTDAIIEHNMLSISKIYKNIKIKSLASLLKVDQYKAERIAAKMISEERMKGSIDQIDGFIHFKSQIEANTILTWDKNIESLCYHVNHIYEMMYADSSIREWMNKHFDNQMSL